jgi:hypothetical protein
MSVERVEQLLRSLSRIVPPERLFSERRAEIIRERLRANGVNDVGTIRHSRNP